MSTSLNAIIIDDESSSRNALLSKLADHCPDIVVVAGCETAEEGKNLIEEYHPDIVFLDIEMPRINGFTMLQQLTRRNFEVIFITAYDHYAIKAIRFSALDYLVKPVEVDDLKAAVAKAVQKRTQTSENDRLDLLVQNMGTEKKERQRMAVPSMEGLQFIRIDTIIYLEAQSNYTILYRDNGKELTIAKTLKEFEDMLPTSKFIRIHHSYLINCNAVERYIKGDGGQVVMKNTAVLDVSKRRKSEFLKAMQE